MSALASAQRKKAIEFQTQATAALQKKSWFASGRERNQEEAAELYQQAANAYKVGGFGHEAGLAYTEAATLYRDALKNPVEASKCFSSAGTACSFSSRTKYNHGKCVIIFRRSPSNCWCVLYVYSFSFFIQVLVSNHTVQLTL